MFIFAPFFVLVLLAGIPVPVMKGSIPRFPFRSHSPVHSKNNSYFVGINPQFNKEIFEVFVVCKNILPGLKQSLITVR